MRTACFLFLIQIANSFAVAPAVSGNSSETDLMVEGRRVLMSDDVMDGIKAAYSLKETANPSIHFLSPKNMVLSANGVRYPLRGLEQVSVLSSDAKILVDGKRAKQKSTLWRGTVEGATVFLRKNRKGVPNYVNIKRDSRSTSFVALDSEGEENLLVEVQLEDADKEKLKRYHSKAKELSEDSNREVREVNKDNWRDILDGNRRDLQNDGTCSSKKEIEVAIAFDHTFCNNQGGETQSLAKIETIVGMASELYAPLCIQLKLSAIDGHCQANSDPYHDMDMTRSGCGGGGLLMDFRNHWNANNKYQNVARDAAHLFVGSNFLNEPGTIGCAWVGALCNSNSYGVDDMSFTSNEDWLANLFAHELGHNCGARHSSPGTIMSSSVNNGGVEWADDSATSITNYVGFSRCVATFDNDDDNGGDGGGGEDTGDSPTDGDGGDGEDTDDSPTDGDAVNVKNKNRCLTIPQGDTPENIQLAVSRCSRKAAERQKWNFGGTGPIQAIVDTQYCLQPKKVAGGSPVVTKKCSGQRKQRWILSDDGAILYTPNKNMCLRNKNSALVLGTCKQAELKSNRKWTMNSAQF